MGLFSIFKKKKKEEVELSKKYLSIGEKRYDENDLLSFNEVYQIFKKYQGFEKEIDLSNEDVVHQKVQDLMSELVELKILCMNYDEFGELYNNYREIPLQRVDELGIMECMVLITSIQRRDYWTGVSYDVFYGYTKNGLIPRIIDRIISLYEKKVNVSLTKEEIKDLGIKFIKEKLNLSEDDLGQLTFRDLDDLNALYISLPTKTGFGLIVGNDGQVLYANSGVSFDVHVEEYKKGRRTSI